MLGPGELPYQRPAREITDKYQHRTFNEEFDTAHPVFQWIYRVSRNWSCVHDLVPQMKSHLAAHSVESEEDSKPISSASSANYDAETYSDYSIIFRERFCCAAASLAASMHIPTERMGVLYDKIIDTGTRHTSDLAGKKGLVGHVDLESGTSVKLFGRGQLLFLTRQVSSEDADKLLNAGYRFASTQQIGKNLSQMMQIPHPTLEYYLVSLRQFSSKLERLDKPGTWLSFFGLIPKPNSKGFDVGVKQDDQDQLPDVQILPGEPQQWHIEFLQRMDGLRTRPFMAFLEDRSSVDRERGQREQEFATTLLQAITSLSQTVPTDWFREARFYARPVLGHYSHNRRHRGTPTIIFAFCVIADMHSSLETCNGLARVPLGFFSTRQRCYGGSPDHGILARDIHQEFGPLLGRRTATRGERARKRISLRRKGTPATLNESPVPRSRKGSFVQSDSTSEHELMEQDTRKRLSAQEEEPPGVDQGNSWGGILVNSETVIKSDSKSEYSHDSQQLGFGINVAVSTAKQEDTFVDELMEVTRTRFMAPKVGF